MHPTSPRYRLAILGAAMAAGFAGGWFAGRSAPEFRASGLPSAATNPPIRDHPLPDAGGLPPMRPLSARPPVRSHEESRSTSAPAASLSISPADLADLALASPPPLGDRVQLFGGADPVAGALAITPEERSELEAAWKILREEIHSLQLASLEYSQSDDALWIGSAPFDGSSLRDRFVGDCVRTIGNERATAMLRLLKADRAFGNWGAHPSSACSLEHVLQEDGSLLYRVTERISPDAPPGRTWIAAELPPHLHRAAQKLGVPVRPSP